MKLVSFCSACLPQQVFSIVQSGSREPAGDLIHGSGRVHGHLTCLRAHNPREVPDLRPELVIVLHTPLVEVVISLQLLRVLLIDQLPQLSQLVSLQ